MPTYDTTSISKGYEQNITDWILGDDRQFVGDAQTGKNPPPPGDLSLTDAYFTLKQSASDSDANAKIQKHITTALTAQGQITAGVGGAISALLFKIASGDYQALVVAGAQYYWDIRCITVGGVTFTVASGIVQFIQEVTQTDKAGIPAAFPNSGVPQFRGFISQLPNLVPSNNTLYNAGDTYFNSNPLNGNGALFICTIGGPAPQSTWLSIPAGTPPSPPSGFVPVTNWMWGNSPPLVGLHGVGDIVWNLNPDPFNNNNVGWVCTTAGIPGIWYAFGLLSDV